MQLIANFLRRWGGWLVVLVLAAAGAGGYYAYDQYQQAQTRQQALDALRTEVVQRGDIVATVGATGALLPERQSSLFFNLPGTVAEVLVSSGDTVRRGQLLAGLDDTDLQLAAQQARTALAIAETNRDKLLAGPTEGDVAVAKANLRGANAQLGDLMRGASEQEVAIAQLKYDSVLADYQRAADRYSSALQFGQDYPQFALPQDQLDALKAGVDTAFYAAEIARLQLEQLQSGADPGSLSVGYARVTQAQAVVEQVQTPPTELQIAQADLAVEQARTALLRAERRLAQAELLAPFDGVVAVVNLKVGEPAGGGTQPVLVLLDLSRFHMDLPVSEVDVAQLEIGQAVSVTVDALPDADLSGRVTRLAPTALSTAAGVNYTVRVVLDPSPAALRTGMSATAQVVVAEVRGAVLVPNWAIRRDRRTGQAFASLKRGDTLEEVAITTGLRGDAYTQVLSGVVEGDVAAVSTAREQLDFLGGG